MINPCNLNEDINFKITSTFRNSNDLLTQESDVIKMTKAQCPVDCSLEAYDLVEPSNI